MGVFVSRADVAPTAALVETTEAAVRAGDHHDE
jgi:hypothetical protein